MLPSASAVLLAISHCISLAVMPDTIILSDSEDSRPWKREEWIGVGKKYPPSPPACVLAAREEVLRLSPLLAASYTGHSILSLCHETILPSQSSSLVLVKPEHSYSKQPPNEDNLSAVVARPIPTEEWINGMHVAFGQAWFDGAQSVVDPLRKDVRLPFPVLTFWRKASGALARRAIWLSSDDWLERCGQDEETAVLVRGVRDMLGSIAWDAHTQAFNSSTEITILADLLADKELTDEIFNMLLCHLDRRARHDPDLQHVAFAPVQTEEYLRQGFLKQSYKPARQGGVALLHLYQSAVEKGRKSELWTGGNPGRNHWVAVKVDFLGQLIQYGSSYGCHPLL